MTTPQGVTKIGKIIEKPIVTIREIAVSDFLKQHGESVEYALAAVIRRPGGATSAEHMALSALRELL